MKSLGLIISAALTMPATALAEPIAVYRDGFSPDEVEALRADAAVRGERLTVLESGAPPPAGHAVVYRDGNTLVVEAEGERVETPLPHPSPSPRALAAMASDMLEPQVDVEVEVRVQVKSNRNLSDAADAAVSQTAVAPAAPPTPDFWYLDVGGMAATREILAAHAGLGLSLSPSVRAEVLGHVASLPDNGLAAAASVELSHVWGKRLRLETGVRALAIVTRDGNPPLCIIPEGCMAASDQKGVGTGAFVGIGTVTPVGTLYLRGGADVVQFENENGLTLAPSGAVGLELPL